MSQLVCEEMLKNGGIEHYEKLAEKKAAHLYDFIDKSKPNIMNLKDENKKICYKSMVDKRLRSRQNVTFSLDCVGEKLPKEVNDQLLMLMDEGGFRGVKGHQSVGGLRASMYNGLDFCSVVALVELLEDYQLHCMYKSKKRSTGETGPLGDPEGLRGQSRAPLHSL